MGAILFRSASEATSARVISAKEIAQQQEASRQADLSRLRAEFNKCATAHKFHTGILLLDAPKYYQLMPELSSAGYAVQIRGDHHDELWVEIKQE